MKANHQLLTAALVALLTTGLSHSGVAADAPAKRHFSAKAGLPLAEKALGKDKSRMKLVSIQAASFSMWTDAKGRADFVVTDWTYGDFQKPIINVS